MHFKAQRDLTNLVIFAWYTIIFCQDGHMIGIGTKNHQYNIDEIESWDILQINSHSTWKGWMCGGDVMQQE